MPVVALALAGVVATTSGCHALGPWESGSQTPTYESAKEITVATHGELQASLDEDSVRATLVDAPQCKEARFGHMVLHESRHGKPSAWSWLSWEVVSLGVLAGGIALVALGPKTANGGPDLSYFIPGIVVLGIGFNGTVIIPVVGTPWFLSENVYESREKRGEPTSAWSGRSRPCKAAPPAGARATLTLTANFPEAPSAIVWTAETDSAGHARFKVRATIEGIAKYCGRASVRLTESRAASGGESDEGTPEAPASRHLPASSIAVEILGARTLALASLTDPIAHRMLQKCCMSSHAEDQPRFQEECVVSCLTEVGAERCVLKRNGCLAVSGNDKGLCQTIVDQCLQTEGIPSEKTTECQDRCARRKVDAVCGAGAQ